ncbi:MAG: YfhO family protein [Bacteroidaceae bacterium]|nr:YfhO family protein [Bacteroidaceae bacterium]
MNSKFRKILPDIICILMFAVVSLAYFYPAVFDGRKLDQHDHGAATGIGAEIEKYRADNDGETPRWINSLFSGMPTYQIAPSYDSVEPLSFIENAYHLWLPNYVYYIFISMLGFYILLRAFDFRHWMSALGAIVWAFSSYFFIIIAAGHIWKVLTLTYIPPMIAGIVLCYKGRYLWGGVLTALFAALQIKSNHVQMTYYFLIPEILMVIAYLIDAIRSKRMPRFFKATGALVAAAVVAISLNLSNLYHTYEYSKDTMRGKSELVKEHKPGDQTDSGLERSYITAWSYGIGETWSLLIPDIHGGASVPLSLNSTAMKKANPQFSGAGLYGAFTQYWGEQPGTSGPVYVGALVCMLFVLGLIIIPNKNPLKWALVAATVLSILLSWGKNFMPFTNWFIDNVPMYAKFRTVSSILVVAEFTIPMLAMLALKRFVDERNNEKMRPQLMRGLTWSAAITAGICILFAVAHSSILGDCISSSDRASMAQYVGRGYFDQGTANSILDSISTMRGAMLSADAWRSVFIILLGTIFMYAFFMKKTVLRKSSIMGCGLILICLIDMWTVNKRYLNDSMFIHARGLQGIAKTDADKFILAKSGEGRDYRVLNFTVSTFNDNTTSAFYSSIGGYHAAKLRRYQELVEEHIAKEMNNVYKALGEAKLDTARMMTEGAGRFPIYDFTGVNCDSLYPVLNMLNTRWFILGGGQEGKVKLPVENTAANGNAWFVDNIKFVSSANEEIDALHYVNPKHTAVVDNTFKSALGNIGSIKADSTATVKQTEFTSTKIKYEATSKNGGIVVFSEIYYPGWTATIDGKPAEIARANYVLRAMNIPAGKHVIEMTFEPESVETTETIAYAGLGILILGLVVSIAATAANLMRKKD